jgi:hypothetical protein
VFVDTLGRVRRSRSQPSRTTATNYGLGAALKALAYEQPGMGLVANHHDRKVESADYIDDVTGTNGLAGRRTRSWSCAGPALTPRVMSG